MAHSERTRPSRNGGANAGQRAVRPRPRLAQRQDQLPSPDQAEFVLCEQTIFAMSSPIMVMLIAGGSLAAGSDDRTLAHRCRWGPSTLYPPGRLVGPSGRLARRADLSGATTV